MIIAWAEKYKPMLHFKNKNKTNKLYGYVFVHQFESKMVSQWLEDDLPLLFPIYLITAHVIS